MRTQVAIVGAGPAGLLLSHLLYLRGISSVVLEARSRDYVEHRVRAGVLEQGTVDTLVTCGVGERLLREGLVHHGIELRFGGQRHRIAFERLLPGRAITVYGQQEVVKDLIAARLEANGQILFEVSDVAVTGADAPHPEVSVTHQSRRLAVQADFVAWGATASTAHAVTPSRRACSASSTGSTRSAGSACWPTWHRPRSS